MAQCGEHIAIPVPVGKILVTLQVKLNTFPQLFIFHSRVGKEMLLAPLGDVWRAQALEQRHLRHQKGEITILGLGHDRMGKKDAA